MPLSPATQELSTIKLIDSGGNAVVGECCATFSLFQVIYLLPIKLFYPHRFKNFLYIRCTYFLSVQW